MIWDRKPKVWIDPAVADRNAALAGLNITIVALFLLVAAYYVFVLSAFLFPFRHAMRSDVLLFRIMLIPMLALSGLIYNLRPPMRHWLIGGGIAVVVFAFVYFFFG